MSLADVLCMTSREQNHDAGGAADVGGAGGVPLPSQFSDDQDMVELIEYFVTELEHRIVALANAVQEGDAHSLRTLAHQLKGAAAGYGYPSITDAAARIEDELLRDEAQISEVTEMVEELILLCRRAAART